VIAWGYELRIRTNDFGALNQDSRRSHPACLALFGVLLRPNQERLPLRFVAAE